MNEQMGVRCSRSALLLAIGATLLTTPPMAKADDEIALFDSRGKATAYVALEDGLTIYFWSGKPVAYLDRDTSGGFHVYGFNGKHLGWFIGGLIRDNEGDAACAVKERLRLA